MQKNISLSKAEPAQGLSMLEHIACTRQCQQKADGPWPDDLNLYVSRGLQANLAAWYPWKNHLENVIRMDSCAIIVIGPVMGLRNAEKDVRPNSAA